MGKSDKGPDQRTERLRARAERIERRQKRANRDKGKQLEGQAQNIIGKAFFPSSTDPLKVFDRNDNPADLRGLWAGASGFLVCGGPSVNAIPSLAERLQERGIVSLAVNNSAGYLPVRAMTFSDPPEKFHHGIFFDPALMKFVPKPKMRRGQVRIKYPDGSFKFSGLLVRDCPNVWGYERNCEFRPEKFLTSEAATWGNNDQGVKATGGPKLLFTMFLGLRLLHYLGCKRVFLLGADFRMSPDKGYSFSQGRTPAAAMSNNNSYRVASQFFATIRPVLEDAGMEVYNANPTSALESFDYRPFDECFTLAKGFVPQSPFDLADFYSRKGEVQETGE
jgi:hypothetical protein